MRFLEKVKAVFRSEPANKVPTDRAPRLLIVDDSLFERAHAKEILSNAGFEIVGEATNGLDAVEKFKETRPDLVLMNVVMPFMTGIDATRKIKEVRHDAVIVASDSAANESIVTACIEAGAVDFVARPYLANRLVLSAKKALGLILPAGFETEVERKEATQETNRNLPRAVAIKVVGPAVVRSLESDEVVADQAILAQLDGATDFTDDLAAYIAPDEPLADCGLTGGTMLVRYDPNKGALSVVSEFQAPRSLSADALKALVEFTVGQWSDGAGENFSPREAANVVVVLNPQHGDTAISTETTDLQQR